jgi:hypothetical protein
MAGCAWKAHAAPAAAAAAHYGGAQCSDAQRADEPVFKRSDTRLLRLVAGLRGEPTDGWRLQYRSTPRDPMELDGELNRMKAQLDAGLLDVVTAYRQLHPGLTRPEAEAAVIEISATRKRIADASGGAPAGDASGPTISQPVSALSRSLPSVWSGCQ